MWGVGLRLQPTHASYTFKIKSRDRRHEDLSLFTSGRQDLRRVSGFLGEPIELKVSRWRRLFNLGTATHHTAQLLGGVGQSRLITWMGGSRRLSKTDIAATLCRDIFRRTT